MFSKPPKPETAGAPPTRRSEAMLEKDAAERRGRRSRGYATTVLGSEGSLGSPAPTSAARLLGGAV